ncbi:MAG TPA: helix-turn-helix domain-containing protein [Ktedonobacterales bacterium]|jgi:excisionase family DNA binding protein
MSTLSPEPVLLTIEQASKRLGFAKSYVYREFIQTGRIRAIRFGPRARRVPDSEISRFIRETMAEQYPDHPAAQ